MAPIKFKATPSECNFCNRNLLQFTKMAPLTLITSSVCGFCSIPQSQVYLHFNSIIAASNASACEGHNDIRDLVIYY